MDENIPAQKAMLMLWVMLTTNSDVFQGVGAGGDITPIKQALDSITGLDDDTKADMIAATVQNNNFAKFADVRKLFQTFAAAPDGPWPDLLGPKHPSLQELQENIFK